MLSLSISRQTFTTISPSTKPSDNRAQLDKYKDVTCHMVMEKQSMIRAKVLSITDGDTFKVLLRGKETVIRIACIDTPEMSEDPWGQRAKDALTGMLRVGSRVSLMEHDTDRYGRTVAEVYKGRGKNIGQSLVKKATRRSTTNMHINATKTNSISLSAEHSGKERAFGIHLLMTNVSCMTMMKGVRKNYRHRGKRNNVG